MAKPTVLLAAHLKALRLPTFLREYDKVARQCAQEGLDGSGLASELRAQGDFLSVAACEVRPEARKPVTHVHGP